jgi:hypothetical protein
VIVRTDAERADVARARGPCVEHFERAHALCGAAQDDVRVERGGERVCDSRRLFFVGEGG